MAELILFHHALGQTSGFLKFADLIRQAGHIVHTPDLYEGRIFDTIKEGVTHAGKIKFSEVVERGVRSAEQLPSNLVYGGFSLGVLPAMKLAQTRPGAKGALLFHACVSPDEFGSPWPDHLPTQIHAMNADPFFVEDGDFDAAKELAESNDNVEISLYPGDQHLFIDSSLDSYDEQATALVLKRVLKFLDNC